MTCFICKKEFSRLDLHMIGRHKVRGTTLEPKDLKQFLSMFFLEPKFFNNLKILSNCKQEIYDYLYEDKDFSPKVKEKLIKCLTDYKREKGMKLLIKVASKTRSKCDNDMSHLQEGIQKIKTTPESSTQNERFNYRTCKFETVSCNVQTYSLVNER